MKTIKTISEYKQALRSIDKTMAKGEANLAPNEHKQLRDLALLVEKFEDVHFPLPKPKTSAGKLQYKIFSEKLLLKQGETH